MSVLEEGAKFGTKLLETVDKFTGPWNKRRQNKADQEAEQKKIDMIRNNPDMDIVYVNGEMNVRRRDPVALAERAQQRELADSIRQQENLEDILELAAGEGEEQEDVSDKPVDEDWITRFFSIAKDINSDEMKIIWAKILAGEIKQPGRFSLRLLDTLRNLSTEEAQIFRRVIPFLIQNGDSHYVPAYESLLRKYGINYDCILRLDECGLIKSDTLNFSKKGENCEFVFCYGDNLLRITATKRPSNRRIEGMSFSIHGCTVTGVGNELLRILEKEYHSIDYLKDFASEVHKLAYGYDTIVSFHRISKRDGKTITYDKEPFESMNFEGN